MVGIVFLIHITAVAFIIGIAMIAPVAEILGRREGGERWERLAHQLSSTIEHLFAWGATWAAFSLVAIWGLFPRLWGFLSSLFLVPEIIIGALLWFVMTVSAYLYYITWERLRQRKGLHNAIGWTFTIATMLFISFIVVLSSYQLTPVGGVHDLLAAALNPSYPTEIIHRHFGNLSYGGLLLAGYVGGWFLLFRGTGRIERANKEYHDWLGDAVLLIGLSVMLVQPIIGWFYSRQIEFASPSAWNRMMLGQNAWLFLVQIGLVGITFLLGNLYMFLGLRRGNQDSSVISWMRISLWLLVLLVALGIIPKELPLGTMRPWKYISLGGFMVLTIVNLILYLRARRSFSWGLEYWQARATMLGIGITIVATIVVMGIIRESARGPDPINHQMVPNSSQELLRP